MSKNIYHKICLVLRVVVRRLKFKSSDYVKKCHTVNGEITMSPKEEDHFWSSYFDNPMDDRGLITDNRAPTSETSNEVMSNF